MCCQVIATTTDNRNGNVVAKKGNIYISETMIYTTEILKANLGFSTTPISKLSEQLR